MEWKLIQHLRNGSNWLVGHPLRIGWGPPKKRGLTLFFAGFWNLQTTTSLRGGFKQFLCSSLFGEDMGRWTQFDLRIFFRWVETNHKPEVTAETYRWSTQNISGRSLGSPPLFRLPQHVSHLGKKNVPSLKLTWMVGILSHFLLENPYFQRRKTVTVSFKGTGF